MCKFDDKLKEFNRLMKFASWRYSIPGILDQSDLYQEACLILNKAVKEYADKPDVEFRKLFKTELWHGLSSVLHRHKRFKRDYRSARSIDSDPAVAKDVNASVNHRSLTESVESESRMLLEQEQEAVDRLLSKVVAILEDGDEDDAVDLLREMLSPTPWADIPDAFKSPLISRMYSYERPPTKVPRHIIADMLGLSLSRVKVLRRRIARLTASVAAGESELLPRIASLNKESNDERG